MMKLFFTLLIFILFSEVYAQNFPKPYERISITVNYSNNFNKNEFHEFWNETAAGEINISTPFQVGNLFAGVQFTEFDKIDLTTRDFNSLFYYLGWELDFRAVKKIGFSLGFRFGLNEMRFEQIYETENENLLTEREIALGINMDIYYQIFDSVNLKIGVNSVRIFSFKRIDLIYFNAGLTKEFETPDWLKEFLK